MTTFSRNKAGLVTITFKNITQGEALALCFAISERAENSWACEDLKTSLGHTIQREGKTDQDQELFASLTK